METLIVSQREVAQALPMNDCMDVLRDAFKALARGDVVNPLRWPMWLPDKSGLLGMMPAYAGHLDVMGLKATSVFPGNHGTQFDAHQGAVLLFETKHGSLLAIIDASAITAIRTAAASGVATDLLAREDASTLAMLGSGVQAHTHLEAMLVARPIQRVRVWSRTPEHAAAFAGKAAEKYGIEGEAVASAQAAVSGADIICTTTSARDPILMGDWLPDGVHINAVGSSVSFARELDTAAVVRSRLYVDLRESTLNEAGDFLFPKEEGAITGDHIQGEIGELLLGTVEGRQSPDEITLFKSLGLAVEDLAAAYHIYHTAREKGIGTWLEMGGSRHV